MANGKAPLPQLMLSPDADAFCGVRRTVLMIVSINEVAAS